MRPQSAWHDSETRVNMLTFLSDSPKTEIEVCRRLRLSRGNIWTHALKLEDEGLLKESGSPKRYHITAHGWSEMSRYLNHVQFTLSSLRRALTFSSNL